MEEVKVMGKTVWDQTLQEWAGAGANKTTLALVFTDIVNSTAIGNTLGDDRWIELLMRHFARARELKQHYDCYEIKVIGDSFMVAFRTAYDALKFAIDFYCNTGDPQIRIRAGIHIGQVRIIDDDIYGRMVNFTSRVEHSREKPGIALSNSAKEDVEGEVGSESREIRFAPYKVTVKGFTVQPILWQAMTRQMRQADMERNKLTDPATPLTEVERIKVTPPVTPPPAKPRPTISPDNMMRIFNRPKKNEG
jgi:class 3 adenylate cyclase